MSNRRHDAFADGLIAALVAAAGAAGVWLVFAFQVEAHVVTVGAFIWFWRKLYVALVVERRRRVLREAGILDRHGNVIPKESRTRDSPQPAQPPPQSRSRNRKSRQRRPVH